MQDATNIFTITIKFSIKNLLAKPPSSSQWEKAQEGKIKPLVRAAPCGLHPYPVLATRSLGYHCFHTIVLSPTVVHHPAVRAQGVHISLWW